MFISQDTGRGPLLGDTSQNIFGFSCNLTNLNVCFNVCGTVFGAQTKFLFNYTVKITFLSVLYTNLLKKRSCMLFVTALVSSNNKSNQVNYLHGNKDCLPNVEKMVVNWKFEYFYEHLTQNIRCLVKPLK